ncbi:GMC family oxidoreductase [Paracoccus versutus]|uniref:Choline dehydrogenase n=1 Tax=Paracoccus versutus TaxID=34007 RepID=A0A3D9XS61_PARVE|nr:GMC family oxidoreductase N-terminal domain-containing protein [Paracoccus versutus]REF73284.1 choline dehydrogenase [Paracoccus versutus]WGR54690.1 choline dehydrogenase [Paracoccus versutus]
METYDYIVIGAGSAGCAVTRALVDNPENKVLLIEAGPHANRFWVNTPAGMATMFFHKVLNWNFHTEPMPNLQNRRMYWARGKLLGGSSSINGMIYIRGHPKDFDYWRDQGNPGWGYDDLLPYFKKMEHFERRSDEWRGQGGPLWVSDPVVKMPSSFDFIEAANSLQIPVTEDMNGEVHDGVGFMQHTIRDGRRWSAYKAFVKPVEGRPNLTILTEAHVRKITFEGRTATGVEIQHKGQRKRFAAAREVVVSSGAINSAQLLLLSGVGPAAELGRHGIEMVHESPGVGENLQDHFYVHAGWRATEDSSYNRSLRGLRKYWQGFKYLMTHKGYLALGASQVAAFVKSNPGEDYADLQISFRPMTFDFHPSGRMVVESFPGVGASVYPTRPKGRGRITLRSADPMEKAVCDPNFMSNEDDNIALMRGFRIMRQIVNAEPMARRILGEELPGPLVQTDEEIFGYMRSHGATPQHTVGTCKMGRDAMAVVDERLRVRGLDRLRVIDASIMPQLTSGNTNSPSIVIGVKGGDMLCADKMPRRPVPSL